MTWVESTNEIPVGDLKQAAQVNGAIRRAGKAYGFGVIANLASLVPEDAVSTADSYALYTMVSDTYSISPAY